MNSPYRLSDFADEPKELWAEDGVPHLAMFSKTPKDMNRVLIIFFILGY